MNISVVIPVYNGAQTIEELVRRLSQVLPSIAGEYEVILVNDGSRDTSGEVTRALEQQYPWVNSVELMRNYGQHNAVLCGIRLARYEVILTMDDDLQHPPEEIEKLLAKLEEGFDVVYGTPQKEQHGLWRDLASQITKLALKTAMGTDIARNISAFRALRTQVRDAFADYQDTLISIDVLLTWGTNRFAAVPVNHQPRQGGRSNYTFHKLVRHALNMITGFSVLPLQMVSVLGFGFTLFGMLVLVYVLGRYFIEGGSVSGFPFLASIIAIFSGAQMLALGIIGEYLSRMHFRTMRKPPYVVRDHSKKKEQE